MKIMEVETIGYCLLISKQSQLGLQATVYGIKRQIKVERMLESIMCIDCDTGSEKQKRFGFLNIAKEKKKKRPYNLNR
jgi:hypothetical protein